MTKLAQPARKSYRAATGGRKLRDDARREVEKYLKSHRDIVWPDEMAEKLGLDCRLVLDVVSHLIREGKVEEIPSRQLKPLK